MNIVYMDKFTIEVPSSIRYISDWAEFNDLFPRIPHILDKQIPGCGFTEWCLTSPENVILCSPRNMLILNKWEQHPEEVYRVYNSSRDMDPEIDKEIDGEIKPLENEADKAMALRITVDEFLKRLEQEQAKADEDFRTKLKREISQYFHKMDLLGKPYKILVTYDSFRILKEIIRDSIGLESFQIIVDEFQSIFIDSRFKSTTELEFVDQLKGIDKVCFVSATPMIGDYMALVPEFKDLPYYELDWEKLNPLRVMRPNLKVRVIDSIGAPAKRIIDKYKTGDFEVHCEVDKETGEIKETVSKEAMIYVNSVKNIIQIIKKCKLEPEECNILCSNTPENLKKIQKGLNKKYTIGKVPLRNEPRKMFTLCTRTVYLGADFYSDNARTFIFSDANIDCLAVDISLDLPQIMGRQRLNCNPWKNDAEFFYKPIKKNKVKMTKEMFDERIQEKLDLTKGLLKNYESAVDKDAAMILIRDRARERNYRDDYAAMNTHAGNHPIPVINNLVLVAEMRAFDIQQTDYADRFSVFTTIEDTFGTNDPETAMEVKIALIEIAKRTTLVDKLRWICESRMSDLAREIVENQMDEKIKSYLSIGRDRLRAIGYNITRINEIFNPATPPENLRDLVYENFHVGDRLERRIIKKKLNELYSLVDYNVKAKASDIETWFETKRASIQGSEGFELLRKINGVG